MREDYLWTEKYRPKTIEDTILPTDLKNTFQQFVNQKNIPNMILAGGPGVGKTTVARALLDQLKCDYIVINGSLRGNIDTLRMEIQQFASSVSLLGGRKYVILDEADYLNPNSTQPALRNFMEEYSRNCGFILTCNFKNRIIEPLHSRCSVVDFAIPTNEKPSLASEFFKRVKHILSSENVEFEPNVVGEVIKKYFPDNRRILNELQRYSATGKIDSGILANLHDVSILSLIKSMKEKDFTEMRKWVAHNIDNDVDVIFRKLYDSAHEFLKPDSVPALVVAIGEYQYKSAFVADQEINLAACLTEIMYGVEFR